MASVPITVLLYHYTAIRWLLCGFNAIILLHCFTAVFLSCCGIIYEFQSSFSLYINVLYCKCLLFAARCYARAALDVMRCLCVCHVRTFCQMIIFKDFSPLGSHTILVFPYQTAWQYSSGNPPPLLTGTSNAGGVGRNRHSEPISGFTACCEPFQWQVQYTWLRQTTASL